MANNGERVWQIRLYVCLIVLSGTFGLMNIVYPLVTSRLVGAYILGAVTLYGLFGNRVGLFPWPPRLTSRR